MSEGIPNPIFDKEPEAAAEGDHTQKEQRKLLGSLVERLVGMERTERIREHLRERSESIRASAGECGPMAVKGLGYAIERYSKLNWKTKLAVTGALMLGVSATATALPIVSGALTVALYGQRLVGAVGLGMNKRKKLDAKIAANPKHWMAGETNLAKNTYAAALAVAYMAGTSFAVHEGVDFLRSLGISDWFGSAPPTPDTSHPHIAGPTAEAPSATHTPDAPTHEAVGSASPETPPAAPTEPAPNVETPHTHASVEVDNTGTSGADTAHAPTAETPTSPDAAPVEAQPESAPEDLSAQEWQAEYADKTEYHGAPEWRAEHTDADFAPEAPAETPQVSADVVAEPQAPPVVEEVVAPQNAIPTDAPHAENLAPHPEHLIVNSHGLSIDPNHAGSYLDAQGNHIIYGGTLDQRAELAKQWAAKDHSSVVFFDSTRPWKLFGLFDNNQDINPQTGYSWYNTPHISTAQWIDAGAESGVRIAEDTNDPSLTGILLPTENDLAQEYKLDGGVSADFSMPPRAEMPLVHASPDDIPRAEMPAPNTGDGFNRPEMQLGRQDMPAAAGPEISSPHPFAHVESGSVKGEFGYSHDGAITSFNSAGMSHGEFTSLLNDNYGETLLNRPGGNYGLARSVVENRARDIFNRTQVLNELIKRGAGESPEADFLKKSIKFTVEQTEKVYGNVFKDMNIRPFTSGGLRDE